MKRPIDGFDFEAADGDNSEEAVRLLGQLLVQRRREMGLTSTGGRPDEPKHISDIMPQVVERIETTAARLGRQPPGTYTTATRIGKPEGRNENVR